MIKLEYWNVAGWDPAIRGMRNPKNSWDKSDSKWKLTIGENDLMVEDDGMYGGFCVGPNDQDLTKRLRNAGTDHRKFMRMIDVWVDIAAPLYWWKEFDTYKVGTVANSCSTMHKIHEKPFVVQDISCDELIKGNLKDGEGNILAPELRAHYKHMMNVLDSLNNLRDLYLKTNNERYWRCMIEMLPSSYNQRRTIKLNYEVLANMYKARNNHKLDEWRDFCAWIEELPYSELITGEFNKE